jgi:hypothetical protein
MILDIPSGGAMGSLVFSLGSADAARLAGTELERNGIKPQQIRIVDRPVDADIDRVLLEIFIDEQNYAAVERVIEMLGSDARLLVAEPAPRT